MSIRLLSVTFAAGFLALAVATPAARAAELVANGGFETGDYTGWSTQDAGFTSFFPVNSGVGANGSAFYAVFGATGSVDDQIFQILPTIAGEQYEVSFYVRNTSSVASEHQFASWEGNSIFNEQPVAVRFEWAKITVNVTATQNGSELRLGGRDQQDIVRLDEVSVIGAIAPEPASLGLLALGAATMLRRRTR